MKRAAAEIIREYGPFPGAERVNGVTYDGEKVWFASGEKLHAFDPKSGKRGHRADSAVTLDAYDASGALIVGPSPYESPVILTIQGDSGNAFSLHAGSRHGTSLTIGKPTSGITMS